MGRAASQFVSLLTLLPVLLAAAVALGCAAVPTRTVRLPDGSVTADDLTPPYIEKQVLRPSNFRDWRPELAVLPTAEIGPSEITIRNVRNCTYFTENDFLLNYYDKKFKRGEVESVDFVMVPFTNMPSLAHTMLSFGFRDGSHVVVSVEARLERGESYSALKGLANQMELMYVIGDEKDLIDLRTRHRKADVYLYPTHATPEQSEALLVAMLERANELRAKPEFYHLLNNNCTTAIVAHVNEISPGKIPFDMRVLLPGLSDELAFDLGLIKTQGTFAQTKQRALINGAALQFAQREDFSSGIRR